MDIAIFGTTPLAGLLAGLLASRHRRRVTLIGAPNGAYRLPHSLDLSVGPLTRPETWELLAASRAETAKLIARIGGKAALERIDPILAAGSEAGREALGHIRVMAEGYGEAIERLADSQILDGASAFRLRDAIRIDRPGLEPVLDAWLAKLGVVRAEAAEAQLVVLADDDAILAYPAALPPPLATADMTTILTEPVPPLVAPVLMLIDRNLTLTQSPGGSVTAFAGGDPATALGRTATILAEGRSVRRAGQSRFAAIGDKTGAPVIGRIGKHGPFVIAGLAPFGAFLAPALARHIAGEASSAEAAFFAARAPGASRDIIADYRCEAGA